MNDFRFLCPNDTVFDQQNFICTNWWEINCEKSTRYYSKNDLFKVDDQAPEYEYDHAETTESPAYYEYVYKYVDHEPPKDASKMKKEEDSHRFNVDSHDKGVGRAIDSFRKPARQSVTIQPTIKPTTKAVPILKTTKHVSKINFQRVSLNPPSSGKLSSLPVTTLSPHYQIVTHHKPSTKTVSESHSTRAEPQPNTQTWPHKSRGNSRGSETFKSRLEEEHKTNQNRQTSNTDEDPFANYDWRRDKNGVTASAKTRYETLFGATSSRGRELTESHKQRIFDRRINRQKQNYQHSNHNENTQQEQHVNQNKPQRRQQNRTGKNIQIEPKNHVNQNSRTPESKHKEFSNFRFYKTAFGRSYSSQDLLGNTGTTAAPFRLSNPVRPEKIASRNTRYSVYAE